MSLAAADFLPPLFFALHFRLRRLFSRSTPVSCCPPRMSVLCVVLPFARLPVAIAPAVSWPRPPRLSSRCRRFPVSARQNIVSVPSCRHRAGRFLAPSAAFPACTSAVSFSRRPQDGKYKYLFRRNSPAGRHGLAGNLLFLHRFERLRRAGQHRFRAEGTRDRIQLKTFR